MSLVSLCVPTLSRGHFAPCNLRSVHISANRHLGDESEGVVQIPKTVSVSNRGVAHVRGQRTSLRPPLVLLEAEKPSDNFQFHNLDTPWSIHKRNA